jgi:O-antigen/teichoic acid export membrane protein
MLFGPEFSGAVVPLQVMALTLPVVTGENLIRFFYFLPRKKECQLAVLVACAAVINLCLAWLLVPRLGASGMAWAILISTLFICGMAGVQILGHAKAPEDPERFAQG